MRCPTLAELPTPDGGRTGWPWTEESPRLGAAIPDGRPWPRITIVTPSLNQADFLEEAIRSVLLQGYPDLEYVVIDGGSHDGSVEIIKKYQPWLVWSVSETDRGQADAINKGLGRATGEIFNWINSDDRLEAGALAAVAQAMRSGIDAFGGGGLLLEGAGEAVPRRSREIVARKIIRGDLDVEMLQPAIWLRREHVLRCGGPDPAFHFYFDMEMYLRYLAMFPRVGYGSTVIAALRLHAASKTSTRPDAFFAEYRRALEKLVELRGFEALRTDCRRRLEELDRHRAVARVLADGATPRWRRAMALLGLATHHPRPRMLHIAAAAIRRLLRNDPWITPVEE
ncbi:MAG: glycosyltransferase family 2 protein [Thermoanaerobaculales bacterium]